eukprot:g38337.t1
MWNYLSDGTMEGSGEIIRRCWEYGSEGLGHVQKSWEEYLAKLRQKLGFWEHCSLSLAGKNLGIKHETLSLLLYVAQIRPIPRTCAIAVTRAIFCFIWRCKMDHVCRETMYKILDKGGKNVPNATLILMAIFDSVLYHLFPGTHRETDIDLCLEDHQLSERHSLVCPKLVDLPEQGVDPDHVLQTGMFQDSA